MRGREPIEFLVLGPLEVRVDGRSIPLGGAKQRAVLGVLLLHPDEVVPDDLIVDGVWGDEPPPSAAHTIEGYVSRLRRAIEPHGPSFLRQGGGYRLDLAGAELDARAARDLLRAVVAASEAGDHERAAALARKALGVWRGPALRDAPLHGAARANVDELHELRLRVGERLADADLALGRHDEAAALLRPLVDEHPYRERLVAQLMLALYRAGRPAEALDVYERTRHALADDLGLKPGAELQRLSGEIVRHDPRLTPPPPAAVTAPVAERPAAAVGETGAVPADRRTVETTSATATFLFTDIEGSTELLKSHRGDYASILADHQRLLREAFTAHGGTEVDSQGDSFFIAFRRAKDAILAAAAGQRALAEHTWPGGASLRVRMGIHTGEADRATDRYVGLSVHRAARIGATGHGGQVLVSQTTASLVEDNEDDLAGIALKDLGEHRLKDIARPVRLYQLELDGLRRTFPPLTVARPPGPNRRKRAALVAVAVLLAGLTAVALALASRDDAPPEILPSSVVRIDPDTLQPTQVVRVGNHADLVVVAGGFVWVTHRVLRYTEGSGLRNAGDRTLTRVDPSTGDALVVGGGLAPCGLAADPSGDVWVANCFASASGPRANVVRVDAKTLEFEMTQRVPASTGTGFFKGITYGGGFLWVADAFGDVGYRGVTRIDPRTRRQHTIRLDRRPTFLAWAEGYGNLWMTNIDDGGVSRLAPESGAEKPYESVATNPGPLIVQGDGVWVGDWDRPLVVRVPAVGSGRPRPVVLPTNARPAGVTAVAAGAGGIWATAPDTRALWRIDPKTNNATRIPMRYYPWGVALGDDGVWVTVRGEDVPDP